MSASVIGRPAGTPSMTAVRASPWDSPAVRKRNTSAIWSEGQLTTRDRSEGGLAAPLGKLSGRRRRRAGAARRVPKDRRGEEDGELGVRVDGRRPLLEEPAEERDVAEQRYLRDRLGLAPLVDAADHQRLAFLHDDLGLGRALDDGGD